MKIKNQAKENGESQYLKITAALKSLQHSKDIRPNLSEEYNTNRKNHHSKNAEYGADFTAKKILIERRSLRNKKRKT
jgi:hypothetical protein